MRTTVILASIAAAGLHAAAAAAAPPLEIDRLTWPELRDRVAAGTTTALVPIGGTEQSGPAIVLGKHNVRARVLVERIAHALGDALVAPVVAYVPEGSIVPPSGHMRFPGTISVPVAAFESVLEGAARSLCAAGFRDVVFLGDHGGYQQSLGRVAAALGRDRALAARCHVTAPAAYYRAAQSAYANALAQRGHAAAEIGTHAGLADAALSLAVDPQLVRADRLGASAPPPRPGDGTEGDPRGATAELGAIGTRGIVDATVAAIEATRRRRQSRSP